MLLGSLTARSSAPPCASAEQHARASGAEPASAGLLSAWGRGTSTRAACPSVAATAAAAPPPCQRSSAAPSASSAHTASSPRGAAAGASTARTRAPARASLPRQAVSYWARSMDCAVCASLTRGGAAAGAGPARAAAAQHSTARSRALWAAWQAASAAGRAAGAAPVHSPGTDAVSGAAAAVCSASGRALVADAGAVGVCGAASAGWAVHVMLSTRMRPRMACMPGCLRPGANYKNAR